VARVSSEGEPKATVSHTHTLTPFILLYFLAKDRSQEITTHLPRREKMKHVKERVLPSSKL